MWKVPKTMRHQSGMARRTLIACGTAITTVGLALSPTGVASATPETDKGPRNVIFMTGDGMAAALREAGRLSLAGLDGRLEMDQLAVSGVLTTDSRDPDTFVTDSAAAATAYATGQKTYNGAISVDLAGQPLPILGAQAKEAGKATGLVTTSQVTDASPAAFFAQVADRDAQDEIARQYLESSRPDVVLGGGEDRWYPVGTPGAYPDQPAEDPEEASSGTRGNLVEQARGLGYEYVSTPEQLAAAEGDRLLGLFANEEMFQQRPEGEGDVYAPVVDLATMTRKALDTLDRSENGFFLVVEEEATDEFGASNNGEKTLLGMQQLDAAVAVVREYVAENPDTLLVVTGDHEVGGLTAEADESTDETGTTPSTEDGPFPIKDSDLSFVMDWTTTSHTDAPVVVSAEGPGAERFTGQHPNTFVYDVLSDALL